MKGKEQVSWAERELHLAEMKQMWPVKQEEKGRGGSGEGSRQL